MKTRKKRGGVRRRRPTAETANLLGLQQDAALPPASHVWLAKHAIERFVERVEPGLDFAEARQALVELKRGAHVEKFRPRWLPSDEPELSALGAAVGYVVIERSSPRCALPVIRGRDPRRPWVAPTCLS